MLKCDGEIIKAFDLQQLDETQYIVYTNCQHNEEISFHNRYLAKSTEPSYDKVDWKLLDSVIDDLVAKVKEAGYTQEKMPMAELLKSRSPRLRKRYKRAYWMLHRSGQSQLREISRVSPVLKKEKMKHGKAPRFVMSRDTRFTLNHLQYTIPIEQAFSKLPQCGIGKNFKQRGDAFRDHVWNDIMAKTDFSKFESSKRVEYREMVTAQFYEKLMGPLWEKEYRHVFKETLHTRGETLNGLKYHFDGCQISAMPLQFSTILWIIGS